MAKVRRITLSALNIALHAPHPTDRYIELIQKAFGMRMIIRQGTLHGAMLGSLSIPQQLGQSTLLSGEIYRFVKLDSSEPWFNSETKEPATDNDVQAINIPAHLLPHLQRMPFVFNARQHRFWYISRDRGDLFAPASAAKFLETLLQHTANTWDFPEVSVTAVPDSNSVEEILELPRLEYLKIELVRPNPDNGESAEARWLRKLEEQNTTKAKLELVCAKNATLEPNQETREMAEVAATNGSVFGIGRSADGLQIIESTQERPMLQNEFVDPEIETAADVLRRAAA